MAKRLLTQRKVPFEEINVDGDEAFDALIEKSGFYTVPQIFFGEELIGGYEELARLDEKGLIEKKLAAPSD